MFKKILLIISVLFSIFYLLINIVRANKYINYFDYSDHRNPTLQDMDIAKVNTAIALQKIAEEGIALKVIIMNAELLSNQERKDQ